MKETDFAKRLRFLRKQRGLTIAALAEKMGISKASVGAWEVGDTVPRQTRLLQLCEIFGVSPNYLLEGAPDEDTPKSRLLERINAILVLLDEKELEKVGKTLEIVFELKPIPRW